MKRKEFLKMKKLIEQILKFGVVGFFCFLIDFGIKVPGVCGFSSRQLYPQY